ncbi:MAG: tRNA (guanosine(37)-N1)-methyltransferase TrmD [bacterium]
MRFDLITLFPGMMEGPLSESILKRAREAGHIRVHVHDLREWAEGKHRQVDDAPFGGGDGMVIKPEPLVQAVRDIKAKAQESKTVLLTPQGELFEQKTAQEWSSLPGLILVCGHYAGVDERARQAVIDHEVSIGDYVISGGELAALVVLDAVARQIPGVLGNESSAARDSFPGRLEWPQYTRPAEFEGRPVPEVLLSGHHQNIERWRKKESLRRTLLRRPDLLEKYLPDDEERELMEEIRRELED